RTAEDGGTVEGIVVRDGRPTAARIEVRFGFAARGFFAGHTTERTLAESIGFAPRPRVLRTADAGDDGRFALGGVPPGQLDVFAVAPDGARGLASVQVAADGARARVTVVVRPTTSLVGRARTVAGAPFVGRVAVTPATAASRPREDDAVALDADGGFTLAGLMPGPHHARFVSADGVSWFRMTPVLPHAGTWEVVVDQGAGALDGRVVDDVTGAGVAGARVVVSATNGTSSVSAATVTGGDGAFVVPELVGGGTIIVAGAEGYAASSVVQVVERPVVIRLARAATLRGTVTRRRDGRPVADAEVRMIAIGAQRGARFGPVFTDAAGRYELGGLPPREVAVSAAAPGLALPIAEADATGWTPTSAALEAGATTVVDVALDDAPVVPGRVLDADGRPVAHAVVTVAPLDESLWRDLAFPERGDVTGDDGAFELDGLPEGATVCLQVTTSVDPEGITNSFVVAAGGPIIEIRVPTARALRVVVTRSHDSAPLPGAHVESLDGAVQASADAHGVAWFAPFRRVGPMTLRVRSPGYATAVVSVDPEAREVAASLGDGARLAGHVRDQVGEPVVGATVMAFGVDGPVGDVRSGPDGSFAFDDVADVDYHVQAHHEDGAPSIVSAAARPGTPCVLTMTRGARTAPAGGPPPATSPAPSPDRDVVVTAVGPDGRPVHEAVLRVWSRGTSMTTDCIWAGIGRVRDPGTDSGRVEVSNPRDEFGRPLPYAPGSATFGPDDTRVEVRLTGGLVLEGRVVTADDGRPLPGIEVGVIRRSEVPEFADARTLGGTLATARTDRDGRFVLRSLPDDPDLRLVARGPPPWILPTPRPVRAGEPDVVVEMTRALRPTVTVLDPDGAPLADVEVRVESVPRRSVNRTWTGRTDDEGRVRLGPLDPALGYALHVGVGRRIDSVPTDVEPWAPRDETIRLRRGVPVQLRVVDEAGRAIGASVSIPRSGGSSFVMESATGVVDLPRQPSGPLRLHVSSPGFVPTWVDLDVRDPPTPVTVRLRPGRDLRIRLTGPAPHPPSLVVTSVHGRSDAEVDAGGSAIVRGLDPAGRYRLWAPAAADADGYVFETIQGFGEAEIVAPVRTGGRIRVRAKLPDGTSRTESYATADDRYLTASAFADGECEFRGVPPGRWRVEVIAFDPGGVESRAEVTAQAGDVLDLVLPPFE
ncbi:MAG: carboxypeptidase regulatory-like domain-containing protein, partial [Planctomycetia bacterium]|nr:carboxypeptidase regulatory-like domain-containing protein [Planctomycetia bacterium]